MITPGRSLRYAGIEGPGGCGQHPRAVADREGVDVEYVTPAQLCNIELNAETVCGRCPIEGAPFPICRKHAAELYTFVQQAMDLQGRILASAPTPIDVPPRGISVVYYLVTLGHIKIGHSSDVSDRLRKYPSDYHLLATEPGAMPLEQRRLRQFKKWKSHRKEYFSPGPPLIDHINQLRSAQGGSPIAVTEGVGLEDPERQTELSNQSAAQAAL